MTTTTAPSAAPLYYALADDMVVGDRYYYQGRTVTVTEIVTTKPGLHEFFEITYMASTGVQRVSSAPKNRATFFIPVP